MTFPLPLIIAITLPAFLAGCGKTQEATSPAVASPACAELDKATDAAQRAELLKKCPRSGTFKASSKKDY